MFTKLLNLIYPNSCVVCGKILSNNKIENIDFACKNCKRKLEYYREDIVRSFLTNFYFDELICGYKYFGIIRKLMLDFKFENKKYLYSFFSKRLTNNIKNHLNKNNIKIDYILYVPISFKRYLERGYNQSFIIAKEISKELDIPLIKFCLIKIKNNKRQSEISHFERIENVKNVYKVNFKKQIDNKTLLLIDDIFTTGATVNACSKVLKNAGAKRIIVATCTKA